MSCIEGMIFFCTELYTPLAYTGGRFLYHKPEDIQYSDRYDTPIAPDFSPGYEKTT